MNILIVLAGQVKEDIQSIIKKYEITYVVAVDGGYNYLDIEPDLYIGDMDSVKKEIKAKQILKLNIKKDNTDYEEALNYIYLNCGEVPQIYVIGFWSDKRLEHFYSNISLMKPNIYYLNHSTTIYMLEAGEHRIVFENYVSFFAYETVSNLTLKNFEYELEDYELAVNDNLCISNYIKADAGIVRFTSGKLLVFLSKDDN